MPTGNQFYVTHCAPADSVLNNPGYSVRAASSRDAELLNAALRLPPYELPIEMWKDLPAVEGLPAGWPASITAPVPGRSTPRTLRKTPSGATARTSLI